VYEELPSLLEVIYRIDFLSLFVPVEYGHMSWTWRDHAKQEDTCICGGL